MIRIIRINKSTEIPECIPAVPSKLELYLRKVTRNLQCQNAEKLGMILCCCFFYMTDQVCIYACYSATEICLSSLRLQHNGQQT